jgi:phage-related holin
MSFFFYCFWIVVSLIYLNFYMFGVFGRSTSVDVLSVFAVFLIVAIPTLIWKHFTKLTAWGEMRREAVVLVLLLVLWLGTAVFLVVVSKGGCVCFYNHNYGISIDSDVELSTDFTRLNSIGTPCPEGDICHLYATVPEDTSTGVFFNVHAGIKV